MTEHVSCDFKCKLNSTAYNSKQNGIIKHVTLNAKIIGAKKITVGIVAHVLVRIVSI